jgi:hypothetical protein
MNTRLIKLFIATLIITFAWSACDKIDDPLVITDQRSFTLVTEDTLFFADSVVVSQKKVLLEYFTGHQCVTCPAAGKILREMLGEHGERLVAYSIHAGIFANATPDSDFETDYRTTVGTTLHDLFINFGVPMGLIDRTQQSGNYQISTFNWKSFVAEQMSNPNQANIALKNTFYPNSNLLLIDVEVEFLVALDDDYHLVLFLVEDDIVSPQKNNQPDEPVIYDYLHYNILRENLTPGSGDLLSAVPISAGDQFGKQYTYEFDADWVISNCKVIAYIGKGDATYGLVEIIQAAELGITTE